MKLFRQIESWGTGESITAKLLLGELVGGSQVLQISPNVLYINYAAGQRAQGFSHWTNQGLPATCHSCLLPCGFATTDPEVDRGLNLLGVGLEKKSHRKSKRFRILLHLHSRSNSAFGPHFLFQLGGPNCLVVVCHYIPWWRCGLTTLPFAGGSKSAGRNPTIWWYSRHRLVAP